MREGEGACFYLYISHLLFPVWPVQNTFGVAKTFTEDTEGWSVQQVAIDII